MPPEAAHYAALKRSAPFCASAGIGALLLTAHPIALALTGAVPAIWLRQPSRLAAYGAACAYYAAAIWPVIPVVHRFNGSWLFGVLIWAGALTALALPWLVFHSPKPNRTFWCGLLATVVSVVPPLGVIGVACPVSSAGLLFPGCKIFGLLATCLLPGLLAWKPKSMFLFGSSAILFANALYVAEPPRSIDWEGVDTVADDTPGAFGDFERIEAMLGRAESSPAKVIVFPEAYIRSWTPTTLTFFDDQIRALREKGKTVLTGALIFERAGYRNVVEAFGSSTSEMDQQVPVPVGMWRPFSTRGVPISMMEHRLLRVQGQRVAISICYEQLIPWPAVLLSIQRPTVAVGIAKEFDSALIPVFQRTYLSTWARLWGTPWLSAVSKQ
jgi:hypothetical protein